MRARSIVVTLVVTAAALWLASSAGPGAFSDYTVTTQTGQSIVPGTSDLGNHCDDCTTQLTFPFPIVLYGRSFASASVSSNGTLQFGTDDPQYSNACLPTNVFAAAVAPYWDDLTTAGSGNGIFSATVGSAPNRQFVLEWRAQYFEGIGNANFEAIFDESSGVIRLRYGVDANNGATAPVGRPAPPAPANHLSAC